MTCYETIMNHDERKKACSVEMLDEIEEWVLIMKHYCFVVASCSTGCGDAGDASAGRRKAIRFSKQYCAIGNDGCLGFQPGRCLTNLESNKV